MANDKNKIKVLVDDDDPTAELEVLAFDRHQAPADFELEASASTCGFGNVGIVHRDNRNASGSKLESDLESRSKTISRLQFDIEQLRAKWLGLETEIQARQALTDNLNRELDNAKQSLSRKEILVEKRDQSIKSLKAEIRERDDALQSLQNTASALREEVESVSRDDSRPRIDALNERATKQKQSIQDLRHENRALEQRLAATGNDATVNEQQVLAQQAGQLASQQILIGELRNCFEKSEAYADDLRRKLQDRNEASGTVDNTQDFFQPKLDHANERIAELSAALDHEKEQHSSADEQLQSIQAAHADEIRTIRFELGEAQETVSQHALINEQLAADLIDTQSDRVEMESLLDESEKNKKTEIEQLAKENRKLRREAHANEDKLKTKSNAINCLLAELAKKSQQFDSISQIEDVIHEIDNRMSERIDDHPRVERDRITRVLIGFVEGQELRFPLFKDRLTIGRTQQNDIQLKASHISRRHAVVVSEGDATRVIDWGSKNGVFVNSRRVTEHFLKSGDIVTIGTVDFRYEERPKRDSTFTKSQSPGL